jgi:Gpi18-like mannosyltransferase
VGIIPIFIGVVLLSICLFSVSARFQNASYAAMNLYSMIQGDELQDVFRDLSSINMITGLLFLYLWVFFGMA